MISSHYRTLSLLLCAVSLYFYACREKVDLEPSDIPARLVVGGQTTHELKKHDVFLSLSSNMGTDKGYSPVSGATMSITDGNLVFPLNEIAPGRYATDSISGTPGNAYTLTINWEGKQYIATDQMGDIPPDFDPQPFLWDRDHFEFEYRRHQFGFIEAHLWQLIVRPLDSTMVPPADVSKLGQQVGIEVFPPANYHFTYFTHPNIEVSGLMNFEEGHFYGFQPGHEVIQKRYSLSDSYYQFLRAVFMETEWRETIFSSTPANVRGNVSGGALGYFSACAVRTKRFLLN